MEILQFLILPFLASLILTGIHAYLGVHVVERGVIFVDLGGACKAGEKAAADFKREDTPRFRCETTSVIFDWTFDGPVNRIAQNKDTIVLEYGQLGLKRTIYVSQKEHPKNIKLSRAGHSIGHWEGDTLVVDTIGFNDKTELQGFRHTESLHMVERFRRPDIATIQYEVTVEDPNVFQKPYTLTRTFALRPDLKRIDEFICENNRDYKPLFGGK